jgi:NADH-quinone oxidoreductase subunit H
MGFALFFLAEYSNIILMSALTSILFLGGWNAFFDFLPIGVSAFNFAIKTMFFITLFIVVRGVLPRYRYDQLMRLGWKVFLPISLGLVIFYASLLLTLNSMVMLIR